MATHHAAGPSPPQHRTEYDGDDQHDQQRWNEHNAGTRGADLTPRVFCCKLCPVLTGNQTHAGSVLSRRNAHGHDAVSSPERLFGWSRFRLGPANSGGNRDHRHQLLPGTWSHGQQQFVFVRKMRPFWPAGVSAIPGSPMIPSRPPTAGRSAIVAMISGAAATSASAVIG